MDQFTAELLGLNTTQRDLLDRTLAQLHEATDDYEALLTKTERHYRLLVGACVIAAASLVGNAILVAVIAWGGQ